MTLPPELQTLKDAAARVESDKRSIADEEAEACWRQLVAVARESLGPLWQYVANMDTRPRWFPRQGPPWGGQVFTAKITVPGHRQILALFDRADWNERDAPECSAWHRSYYPGAPTSDVQDGTAYWMVEPAGAGRIMSYYQTLGGALLAAAKPPPA